VDAGATTLQAETMMARSITDKDLSFIGKLLLYYGTEGIGARMGRCVETTVIFSPVGWGVAVASTWTVAGDTGAGKATGKSLFSVYVDGMYRDVAEKRIAV
jgi:hypothetical protein